MKILIGVPMPDMIPPDFVGNLTGLMAYTRNHLPNLERLDFMYKTGVRTDRNRNVILHEAIQSGVDFDYVLWLDADMLYPHDLICKYLEHDFDVMGCLYFKRAEPFDPIGYVKGSKPGKYKPLDPRLLPTDSVLEVDAVGYGGMMVNMQVYKDLGPDKMWTRYSDNFHLPFDTDEPKLTHDFQFCEDVRAVGKTILLHTGVRPAHLGQIAITQKHWYSELPEVPKAVDTNPLKNTNPEVAVIMPTIHREMADKTAKILQSRAGVDARFIVIEDDAHNGFVKVANAAFNRTEARYVAYVTDDIFPSRGWLKEALNLMKSSGAGLVGFNDGKWKGALATVGLVDREWVNKVYANGNMFFPGYFGHYNDTELTMVALAQKRYAYDPNISLIEVDYEKEQKSVHRADRALFAARKEHDFDGLITDPQIKEMFS